LSPQGNPFPEAAVTSAVRKLCVLVLVLASSLAAADSKKAGKQTEPGAGKKVIVDRVAAVVNESVILISELDVRMLPLRAQAAQIADQAERERRLMKLALQVLDEMINDELVVQAAQEAKLTVDQTELDATLEYLKTQHGLDKKQLEVEMQKQGVTLTTLRNDLLRQRAINQLVGPKVQVTDEDVRARYEEMQRRSASVSGVNVSQVLFTLPEHATEQQQDDAKQKALRTLDRLKAGEPFATVAGGLDAATTKTDGVWLDPGTILPELESVVFAMEKGDVRGPIFTANGIYVLVANDVRRTQLKPFAELKDDLTADLRRKALAKHAQAWIEELRKKAYIDIKLK
jgi:parvulin-like peptidyl-prolyl isomerase